MTSEEKEHMLQKFLKLPLRKDNEQQRQLANEEVFMFQKKFHNVNRGPFEICVSKSDIFSSCFKRPL